MEHVSKVSWDGVDYMIQEAVLVLIMLALASWFSAPQQTEAIVLATIVITDICDYIIFTSFGLWHHDTLL